MDGFYILGGLGLLTLMATICFVMDLMTKDEEDIDIVRKPVRPVESFSLASEYANEDDDVIINDFDYDET